MSQRKIFAAPACTKSRIVFYFSRLDIIPPNDEPMKFHLILLDQHKNKTEINKMADLTYGNPIEFHLEVVESEIESSQVGENEGEVAELLTNFDKESFIEAVRKFRCLWDINDHNYKDRNMKANAWKELAVVFQKDVQFLQKTLKNLKDNLKRCLDRRRVLTKSGAAYTTLPTCKYFHLMAFLHEKTENKPTDSNIAQPNINNNSWSSQNNQQGSFPSTPKSTNAAVPSPCASVCSSDASSTPSQQSEGKKRSKRKSSASSTSGDSDIVFLQQIKDLDDRIIKSFEGKSAEVTEVCEDTSFCRSLIPVLKGLPLKKKRLAKVKINSLLFDIEFSNEYEDV